MSGIIRVYCGCLLLLWCTGGWSQISDDFSGPELTSQTSWVGTPQFFQVQNGELRSNGPEATATLYLSAPSTLMDETEWNLLVRLNFNPSNNNFVRIYLAADRADLTDPNLNGYYIRIGVNGDQDAIDLFRQQGGTSTLILAGPPAQVAVLPHVRLKVTRSVEGLWQIWADLTGGNDFISGVGQVQDAQISTTAHFGIYCQHTLGNRQNFYFDDFYVGPIRIDTDPPGIQSVEPFSSQSLRVVFDEALDQATATQPSHYQVTPALGSPSTAEWQVGAPREVLLQFSTPFVSGQPYTLTVNGVRDLSGNALTNGQAEFTYFQAVPAQPRDIVINEIMANQSPPVGLPEFEYVELYNRSDKIINLQHFTWTDPGATATLPAHLMFPGDYLILCPVSAVEAFSSYGPVMGVSPWPVLNNAGDQIRLRNPEGLLIDGVDYTDQWYRDTQKRNGGWSLELIDPENPCLDDANWRASLHPSGGTPGTENSVRASLPDVQGPRLLSAFPESAGILLLTFDERLDEASILSATYLLEPVRAVAGAETVAGTGLRQVRVFLDQPLVGGTLYRIRVQHILDCSGNLIQLAYSEANLALPEPGGPMDVIINEVLFNARAGGVKFVEVYNRSAKYINLQGWQLANVVGGEPANLRGVSATPLVLGPGQFRVFTTDAEVLKADYPSGKEETFTALAGLPSYPISEGTVIVLTPDGQEADRFAYSERWHFPLLREVRGVSLERISPDAPTQDPNNWKSAASAVGYATPGYLNSQARLDISLGEKVKVDPESILPDNSGYRDFTTISYSFPTASYVANVGIVDMQGREIRSLARNHLLAAEGFYTWDGTDDQGRKVRVGYYLVRFEVFTPEGRTEVIRKRVAVGSRF
jgi:hypothetical protein